MARIGMNGALIEARRLCRIPKRIPPSVHLSQGRHNMRERQDSHSTQPKSYPVSRVHLSIHAAGIRDQRDLAYVGPCFAPASWLLLTILIPHSLSSSVPLFDGLYWPRAFSQRRPV